MKYKMVVSDFDGTLFRSDFTISQKTIDTIGEYVARGGKFVIATGRLYSAIKPQMERIGLTGEVIVYQGAGVFDSEKGSLIHHIPLDFTQSEKVLQFLNKYDYALPMIFHNDKSYIEKETELTALFSKIVGVEAVYTGVPAMEFIKQNNITPSKLLCILDEQYSENLVTEAKKVLGKDVNCNRSSRFLIEFVNHLASKGNAIKWLSEKYSIVKDDIIAIGDAENDISMVEYAGLGVAVENAMPLLKDVARVIAPSNDDDGVARIIEDYCFEVRDGR